MTYYKPALRVGAGPFGYTEKYLTARTPEERAELDRETEALENKLHWGFEPDRFAKGAAWHDEGWPEAKLLGGADLAGLYEQRDDLLAETQDFRDVLQQANKAWKREAGLASPFLPAVAGLPKLQRTQMRECNRMIRDLVAFGETPERWQAGIGYMRDHLRDPEADTERLLALHERRNELIPAADALDHALDYMDEIEKERDANTPAGNALSVAADNGGSPTNFQGKVEDNPADSNGKTDEPQFETGKVYPMPDGTSWRWNGRELVQVRSGGSIVNSPFPDKWAAKGWGGPRGTYHVPSLNLEQERIENILADKPARFDIEVAAHRDESEPITEIDAFGVKAVHQYESIIEREAQQQGVDPDLVRAIIYVENAQGQLKDYLGSFIREPKTLLPMNINPTIWSDVADQDADFSDPETNIRAGVTLIKRISDRVDEPTPGKVASIWNFTGSETGTDIGARIGEVYRLKPWLEGDELNPEGPYAP